MIVGEYLVVRVRNRALNQSARNRNRTIQNHNLRITVGSSLQHVAQGGLVSEEARTDVLDINQHRVQSFEYFNWGTPLVVSTAVHAVDRHTGCRVYGVADLLRVQSTKDSMLRTEDRRQFYSRRRGQHVYRPTPLPVQSGLIGEHANRDLRFALLQRREVVLLQNVNPSEHVPIAVGQTPAIGLKLAVAGDSQQFVPTRRGDVKIQFRLYFSRHTCTYSSARGAAVHA